MPWQHWTSAGSCFIRQTNKRKPDCTTDRVYAQGDDAEEIYTGWMPPFHIYQSKVSWRLGGSSALDPGFQEEVAAKCWLKPPLGASGEEIQEWRCMMARLCAIAMSGGDDTYATRVSELLSRPLIGPDGAVLPERLQIWWKFWNPDRGIRDNRSAALPVYNRRCHHAPPSTSAEIPFNRRVRVLFTLLEVSRWIDGSADPSESTVISSGNWQQATSLPTALLVILQVISSLPHAVSAFLRHYQYHTMPYEGDVFEGNVVRAAIRATHQSKTEKLAFDEYWNKKTTGKSGHWGTSRATHTCVKEQLEFNSEVLHYVSLLAKATTVRSDVADSHPPETVPAGFPVLGPLFRPPSWLHASKRSVAPGVAPETAYIKPIFVAHPVYFPEFKDHGCPQCGSKDIHPDSWTSTGHREVYGMFRNVTAIGYQMRCSDCKNRYGKDGDEEGKYCFSTTSVQFWQNWEFWEMPRGMPVFFSHCAVTRDLFKLIVEMRPSSTSAGLAENIRQERAECEFEYLRRFKSQYVKASAFAPYPALNVFAPLSDGPRRRTVAEGHEEVSGTVSKAKGKGKAAALVPKKGKGSSKKGGGTSKKGSGSSKKNNESSQSKTQTDAAQTREGKGENGYSRATYDDDPITDEIISEVFLENARRTGTPESIEYMKTLTGMWLSFDHTQRCWRGGSEHCPGQRARRSYMGRAWAWRGVGGTKPRGSMGAGSNSHQQCLDSALPPAIKRVD
ncbi:hypothetical protein EIP91_001027 [Steccherinum ochraceum]|uniref:Uncharacterized protein n=1 Tax=Steccherinum ochraceum TaxID=92696 RepID=A0A4R0RVG5_9APHY|nr:hypothetical protein EIP91_001027 [Steccherinum ochraceum]